MGTTQLLFLLPHVSYYTGQEFQAVFINTTEPVGCDGNTINPTKSPCDPFIFNTVLTRSKSLVVAVGSPEALLQTEKHMVQFYGEKARCWSNYMRVCLEKGTFIVPREVENNSVKREAFLNRLTSQLANETTRPRKQISSDQTPTNSSEQLTTMDTTNLPTKNQSMSNA